MALLVLPQCKAQYESVPAPSPQPGRSSPQAPAPGPIAPIAPATDASLAGTSGVPAAWFRFDLEPPTSYQVVRTTELWATYYYVPSLRLIPGGIPIRNAAEQSLFGGEGLSQAQWCDLALQGSGRITLSDGRHQAVSFAGRSANNRLDCSATISADVAAKIAGNRFDKVDFVFGRSATGSEVIPFRTLAVDNSVIPHGTTLYIASARGTSFVMEGRRLTHDGYFFAADSGSAIIGNHVDLFTGTASFRSGTPIPFAFVTSTASKTTRAQWIADGAARQFLRAQHRYGGK